MRAEEIRKFSSEMRSIPEILLAEIAAQLAELNENLKDIREIMRDYPEGEKK